MNPLKRAGPQMQPCLCLQVSGFREAEFRGGAYCVPGGVLTFLSSSQQLHSAGWVVATLQTRPRGSGMVSYVP